MHGSFRHALWPMSWRLGTLAIGALSHSGQTLGSHGRLCGRFGGFGAFLPPLLLVAAAVGGATAAGLSDAFCVDAAAMHTGEFPFWLAILTAATALRAARRRPSTVKDLGLRPG